MHFSSRPGGSIDRLMEEKLKVTDSQSLSHAFSQHLGRTLVIAVSSEPIQQELLGEKGRQIFQGFRYEKRRQEWSCGRHALLQVMRHVGDETDPDGLGFPHKRYSLTHSQGKAIAIADADSQLAGIGIDYESMRQMKPGVERFFLTDDERMDIQAVGNDDTRLLRLWTIKEALFKADPKNGQRLLKDYHLQQPLEMHGAVSLHGSIFHYICMAVDDGFISVAISNSSKSV
ncbi:MAG: 4'-phosphopantetheinyl transferase superfamily protein [Gammaproteobacteria bacterium]|nr:MAG: 4'-phosphopantetheinyl transferase superfamily protein [Gammaproteobacteria bacterium]